VKEGETQEADIQPWIEAVATEIHGWPQHIMVYTQPTAELLKTQNGKATLEALKAALSKGRAEKHIYYHSRLAPLNDSGAKVLATLLQQAPASSGLNLMRTPLLKKLVKKGPMSQKAGAIFRHRASQRRLLQCGTKTPSITTFRSLP